MTNKIAVVTEDGQRISNHFGMASMYQVFTVTDEQILGEETRSKPHHSHHPQHNEHGSGHFGNHDDMFAPISDCQVLICGGMGQPAYQRAQNAGLDIIMTGGDIQEAIRAYLKGQVSSDLRRIHSH